MWRTTTGVEAAGYDKHFSERERGEREVSPQELCFGFHSANKLFFVLSDTERGSVRYV